MQRDRSKRPCLRESSAKHAPRMEHPVQKIARSREDRSGRSVQVFVEGHIHRVERARRFGDVFTGVGRLQEHAGAVEMQPDSFAPCQGRSLAVLRGRNTNPASAYGVSMEMAVTGVATRPVRVRSQHALNFIGGKRGLTRSERNQGQVAQGLSAVAFVLVEMALFLTITRLGPPARARTARLFASVPVGMKTARSFPGTRANSCSSSSYAARDRVIVAADPLIFHELRQ